MQVLTHKGNFLFGTDSRGWKYDPERGYFQECDFSGTVCLSEDDVAAINEIQDRGQQEADAGIAAASETWERRRVLNETARELFRDLYSRCVDLRQADEDRDSWTEEVAKIAANAAGALMFEVEKVAATFRGAGLDVD